MRFAELKIRDWRQFANVEIQFHDRVTIITGSNGAGKSTLVRILAQHFGWNFPLLSTPTQNSDGIMKYLSGIRQLFERPAAEPPGTVGEIIYSSGDSSYITVPVESGPTYNIQIQRAQPVLGLQIDSHRSQSSYQPVNNVPTNALSVEQAYQAYYTETVNKYNNSFTSFSPIIQNERGHYINGHVWSWER